VSHHAFTLQALHLHGRAAAVRAQIAHGSHLAIGHGPAGDAAGRREHALASAVTLASLAGLARAAGGGAHGPAGLATARCRGATTDRGNAALAPANGCSTCGEPAAHCRLPAGRRRCADLRAAALDRRTAPRQWIRSHASRSGRPACPAVSAAAEKPPLAQAGSMSRVRQWRAARVRMTE